jgi:outer membrane protein assembly factor BamB
MPGKISKLVPFLSATMISSHALAQSVSFNVSQGHPNQPVTLSGTGFADREAVDLYFDTADVQLKVSSSTGTITGSLTIPVGASPGTHYLTAIGRRSGDAAQAAITVSTPWLESQFGAASKNWNPFENTIGTANAGTLGLLWTTPSFSSGGAPVVASGLAYVSGASGGMEALKTSDGAVIWSALTTSSFSATPAIFGSYLYAGSNQGVMYELSASTGAVKWSSANFGNEFSSVVVSGGIVYAGNINGVFYAFSAATGSVLWSYAVDTGTYGASGIQGAPAIQDGVVYFGSYNGYVYALNATTGALQWKYATGGPITDGVSVGNGLLYVGVDSTGDVLAINTKFAGAGSVRWSFAASLVFGTPAVAGNIVYAGSANATLYALNATTGAKLWSAPTSAQVDSEPSVANGVVYVGDSSGAIYAFDANYGELLWSAVLGNPAESHVVISDGVAYASNFDETYAFALQAGTTQVKPAKRHAPALSSLHPDYSLIEQR